MTEYIYLKDEEIMYYVHNLNWHLPERIQKEAIQILSQLPPDKVDLLLSEYRKEYFENAVSILRKMGYPRNRKALPQLADLLEDRNVPGALEAIELFRDLGKAISTPYIEIECQKALQPLNEDWLEHLYFACDSLGITEENFSDKNAYRIMKKEAESL